MNKYVNEQIMPMTPEEEKEYNQWKVEQEAQSPPTPDPTPEERMDNLETDVKQMKSEMDNLSYILTGEVLSNAQ